MRAIFFERRNALQKMFFFSKSFSSKSECWRVYQLKPNILTAFAARNDGGGVSRLANQRRRNMTGA